MVQTDFQSVLGQLLADAALRRAFRSDAAAASARFGLCPADQAALLGLAPDELDRQADVLLRKRLDALRRFFPITSARLGPHLWDTFAAFAKCDHSSDEGKNERRELFGLAANDRRSLQAVAFSFVSELTRVCPEAVCPAELNRLRFVLSKARCRFYMIKDRVSEGGWLPALQIFWRWGGRWWEWVVRASLGHP